MTQLELILGVALAAAIVVIAVLLRYARREHSLRMQKQSSAFRLGASQKVGDFSQVLGTFSVLADYDELIMLSSTSAQSSLDLLGLKGNRLDFIEFKSKGAGLSKAEKRIRDVIQSGQLEVKYKIIDVELPDGSNVSTRQ
jgi:hypothetical protein